MAIFLCLKTGGIELEVKINREIRNYTENMFFGLSMRQFIFSVLTCGAAVALYFGLRDALGTETVSWLCMLGAAPFAALGFVRYHGMTQDICPYGARRGPGGCEHTVCRTKEVRESGTERMQTGEQEKTA